MIFARKRWLSKHRESILLASRFASASLALYGITRPDAPRVWSTGMSKVYGRVLGLFGWVFLVLPALQRLTMRVQLVTVPCTLVLSFITVHLMMGDTMPAWMLLLMISGCEVVECGVVWFLEKSMRRQFLRATRRGRLSAASTAG